MRVLFSGAEGTACNTLRQNLVFYWPVILNFWLLFRFLVINRFLFPNFFQVLILKILFLLEGKDH